MATDKEITQDITDKIKLARLNRDQVLVDNLTTLRAAIQLGLSRKQPVKAQKTIKALLSEYREAASLVKTKDLYAIQEKITLVESFLDTGKNDLDSNALQQLFDHKQPESIKDWMAFLRAKYNGRFDGKLASAIFNEQMSVQSLHNDELGGAIWNSNLEDYTNTPVLMFKLPIDKEC